MLECNNCGEHFEDINQLKLHKIQKHLSPQIECSKCKKKFSSGSQVDNHMLEHYGNQPESQETPPCLYYQNGYCRNGNHCRFAHKNTIRMKDQKTDEEKAKEEKERERQIRKEKERKN